MNQKLMLAPSRLGGGIYGKIASMVNQVYKPMDNTYTPATPDASTGLYGASASMVNQTYKPMDNTYTPATTGTTPQFLVALLRDSRGGLSWQKVGP
jgi:hypothetical protein